MLRRRARSRGCRAPGPRSQCGLRLEVERRAARRDARTSTLSAALLPTGTLACGRFGSASSACVALVLDRVELDAELLDLLRARAVGLLNRAPCPCPAAWRWRSRRPTVFCWRFSPSSSGISRRRAVSSVAISSSALSGSSPRLRRPARTVFDVIADVSRDRACVPRRTIVAFRRMYARSDRPLLRCRT